MVDKPISQRTAFFRRAIQKWRPAQPRDMPWLEEKDPYKVWLSEVILQQTTVDQGRPYYLRFCKAFPNVRALARASEDRVLRLWQGLGYYSRARNLHKAAKQVMSEHRGNLPSDYRLLLQLPGIGPYTAAAISSFTANQAHAVVDGNVLRVLSRYFGIATPINSAKGKEQLTSLAKSLLDKKAPGLYNQSLMNFGALQCRPRNPDCPKCPLRRSCVAFATNQTSKLPRKLAPKARKTRHLNYIVLSIRGKVPLEKREGDDIWKGLYQFPLIETTQPITLEQLSKLKEWKRLTGTHAFPARAVVTSLVQSLSHQVIHGRFIEMTCKRAPDGFELVSLAKLGRFALPRLLIWYLQRRQLH